MGTRITRSLSQYLHGWLGISLSSLIGYEASLRRGITANLKIRPQNYNYDICHPVKVKAGTKIRIVDPPPRHPRGYSNNICFEILKPQVDLGNKLEAKMETVVEALRPAKPSRKVIS
jgi:hypothetical protein